MSGYDLNAWPLFRSIIDDAAPAGASKSRTCFVISPIDDPNSDVRRHADAVWKYIIRPALLDTEFEPRRLDGQGGRISKSVFDAVLDDDLVIAVLSFNNPSVYYQTAVAQAAGRPVLLMIEESQTPLFDVEGLNVLRYSLDTDAIFGAVHVGQLQAAIRDINGPTPMPDGLRSLSGPMGGIALSGVRVLDRSQQFTYEARLNLVRQARHRVDIMGVANMAFALNPDTREVLRQRSGQPLEIRVLQSSPSNAALLSLIGPRNGDLVERVKQEIEAAAEAWKRIIDTPDIDLSISVRRTQAVLPLSNALITDCAIVATPYLSSLPTSDSPTLCADASTHYHAVMQQEFDLLWSEAAPLLRSERGRGVTPVLSPTQHPRPTLHDTLPPPANAPFGGPQQPAAGGGLFRGLASIRGPGDPR